MAKHQELKDDVDAWVPLPNGERYSIAVDQLIDMNRITKMLDISRSTLERWLRDGKFPPPHFKFGERHARWVERIVLKFIQENWVVKKVE